MGQVNIKIEDKVGIIELNGNEQNTLTPPFMDLIIQKCEELDNNPDINVILNDKCHKRFFFRVV